MNELHDVLRAVHFARHQRRHEVPRVVHLEPRRLIRDQRVGDGVRLVEAVARERLDVVEDLVRFPALVALLLGAFDERIALRRHDLGVLLPHRLAQQVGLAERVAGDALRDLHHLLLVDDDAVRLLQDLLHPRHEVLRLRRAVLAPHVLVDHAGVERAGAVERVERGEVLELRRARLAEQVDHAARLELEHALGAPFLEEAEDVGIVEREVVDVDVVSVLRLRRLDGVVDDRQRPQAEEVHLQEAHLLDHAHVELRHDFIAVRAVERDVVRHRLRRDDDAGGVHAGVAGEPFELRADLDDARDLAVVLDGVGERGRLLRRGRQRDLGAGRDRLRDLVDEAVRQAEDAADVAHHRLRRHRPEGDDLRDLVLAVLPAHVLDHLAAPVHAEVDVDVGHVDAFGVEEALEEEVVRERIDVGDAHRVGDERAGRGAAPGADRDAVVLRVFDEVPDHEEVAGEAHGLDDVDLALEAVLVLLRLVLARGGALEAPLQAGAHDLFEVRGEVLPLRHREVREVMAGDVERGVDALGDPHRVVDGLGVLREDPPHLLGALHVEVVGVELHPLLVAEGLAGADAEEDFVRERVVLREVVRVVRGDELEADLLAEARHHRHDLLLVGDAVVLDLEEEVLGAEDVLELQRGIARLGVIASGEALGDFALEARREDDQPFAVLAEELLVDPRLVVEAFDEAFRDELDEVLVAGVVRGEDDEVVVRAGVRLLVFDGRLVEAGAVRDVHLAADDRLDPRPFHGVVELDGPEHVAVVGDGARRHAELRHPFRERVGPAGAVEKGVFSV